MIRFQQNSFCAKTPLSEDMWIMTQKFKCPQKTHKFLRIERNRIENAEISIFYILHSILTSFYILYSIFYILYSIFCNIPYAIFHILYSIFHILYSIFLKWYDIRVPVSLGRCEHRLLDCTKISTYQITNIKIFLW